MKNENISFGLVSAVVLAGLFLAFVEPNGSAKQPATPAAPTAVVSATE